MAGLSDAGADNILGFVTGRNPSASRYIAVFSAVGVDAGSGFTEISVSGYARAATTGGTSGDWAAPSGSAPRVISNLNAISFVAAGVAWSGILAWGIYDALTGGTLLWWDYLGAFDWLQFSCTSASPGVLTAPAHTYANGDSVVVDTEFGGESLPTTAGSWSGLLTVAGATTDTFTAGVNTTSTGGGSVRKVATTTVGTGTFLQFPAGQLVLRIG